VAMEMPQPPSVGTFEPNGGSGTVGEWVTFTTTYSDANGYDDIAWAFFFLDRQPPIASGGLAAAYYQPANILLLLGGGVCRPGQPITRSTGYVTLDCQNSSVSGTGDTLTINWAVRPEQCFVGGCGWNYGVEYVVDSTGLSDAELVGWWRLVSARGPVRGSKPAIRPNEVDFERLREEIEAWQSRLGQLYFPPLVQR